MLAVLLSWDLSFFMRVWMAHGLPGAFVWAGQGACRDALPGALLVALFHHFNPQGRRRMLMAGLFTAWTVVLWTVSLSDGAYFIECGRRLDLSLIQNLSLTSIAPAETWPVFALALLLATLLALVGWGAWSLSKRPHHSPRGSRGYALRMGLCLLILLGAAPWARAIGSAGADLRQVRAREVLGDSQAETVAGIVESMWRTGPAWTPAPRVPLADEDQAWARSLGLAGLSAPAPAGQRHWRRVVVIAVESLAAAFLDPGNPRRPAGMTPFLDSLQREQPHLNRCYSAGVDTEQGQYALMCGRTDYEWDGHPYPGESLFSLAKRAGYGTTMIYGDTSSFRDHETAYPVTLHVARQFSRESFVGSRPAGDFCSWGGALCDRAVFEEALDRLQKQRARPQLMLVDTLDTHPPYYWQKADADFPPAVRASASGLPKALNQLDDNLRFFFDGLRARGLMDEGTLVVITADHFPAYYSDALVLSGASGFGTNRIPMIFVTPAKGALAGLDEERLATQLDLAPTLAGLMGFAAPAAFMGRSLLAVGPGRALSRERDLLRLRTPGDFEQDAILDGQGMPRDPDSPLARWYLWRLGRL